MELTVSHLHQSSLKQLIEEFRKCRTKNEERMAVQAHRGYLREHMANLDPDERANGILKLMWMNMLGYDTEFALVECMNSLFMNSFKLKIIGYLGLTMFLSRKSEVLLMLTNRIRMDLEDQNNDFLVSCALKTFSEIADENMATELFPLLVGLLDHDSKFVRKKVCLALHRALREQPSLSSELKPHLGILLKEKNNGLLLCTVRLADRALKLDPDGFQPIVLNSLEELLLRLNNLQEQRVNNYTINSVNDPFLTASLIQLLMRFVALPDTVKLDNYEDIVEEFGTALLSTYNQLRDYGGSTVRAMLYQIARAIMQIPNSSNSLKTVAIAILGSFLALKNRNYLFVSLKMLVFISRRYASEVSRHHALIMRCVNDRDFSIKKMALEVLLNTTDSDHLFEVCRHFFNELKRESSPRKSVEMAAQCLKLILKVSPSRLQSVDLIFQLLEAIDPKARLAPENFFGLFHLVANSPQAQVYACLKALHLWGNTQNTSKSGLAVAVFWILGELGESLTLGTDPVTSRHIGQTNWARITQILLTVDLSRFPDDPNVWSYIMTGLLKIFAKCHDLAVKQNIVNWFLKVAQNPEKTTSLKARQCIRLMKLTPADLEEVLESLGYSNQNVEQSYRNRPEGVVEADELEQLVRDINQGNFEKRETGFGGIGGQTGPKKEDMELDKKEEDQGLQTGADEENTFDLLGLNFDHQEDDNAKNRNDQPEIDDNDLLALDTGATQENNGMDLLGHHSGDVGLLGEDFDMGGANLANNYADANRASAKPDDNDFLGMDIVTPVKQAHSGIVDDGIDQMLNKNKPQSLQKIQDPEPEHENKSEPPKKKRGLRAPRRKSKKHQNETVTPSKPENHNSAGDLDDLDFLGAGSGPSANTQVNGVSSHPNIPEDTNIADDLDFDLLGDPSQPQTNPQQDNQNNAPIDSYGALDNLEDILMSGNPLQTKPTLNTDLIQSANTQQNNLDLDLISATNLNNTPQTLNTETNYDILDVEGGPESLLNPNARDMQLNYNNKLTNKQASMNPGIQQTLHDTNDFNDDFSDDFIDSEVQAESEQQQAITFFENEDIKVEHVTSKFGFDKYSILNYFTNKTGQSLPGLSLNISVQKHIKVTKNRLSSATLPANLEKGAVQTLELHDSSAFAQTLKIKMMLKYRVNGMQRVHKFLVDNYPRN